MYECLVNNGDCMDVCTNTVGSFECSCRNGYEFASLPEGTLPDLTNVGRACIGILTLLQCCMLLALLFYIKNDINYASSIFADIDECERNNDGCSQICSNTIGTYECSCNSGYELQRDTRGCEGLKVCIRIELEACVHMLLLLQILMSV